MAIVHLWEQRVCSLNQGIPTTTVKRCRRTISMLAVSNSPDVSPSCARVLCESTGDVCSWIALICVQSLADGINMRVFFAWRAIAAPLSKPSQPSTIALPSLSLTEKRQPLTYLRSEHHALRY